MSAVQAAAGRIAAPGLFRRLAAMLYEGVLLFGVLMIAGYLFSSLTQQRHALQGQHLLQAFLFVVLGIYFVWFWANGGQTVAMKTWHVRVVDAHGAAVSQPRALARYVAAWVWFVPGLAIVHYAGLSGGASLTGALLGWVALYAVAAHLRADRQFWHDVLCGTRLVDSRPAAARAEGPGR